MPRRIDCRPILGQLVARVGLYGWSPRNSRADGTTTEARLRQSPLNQQHEAAVITKHEHIEAMALSPMERLPLEMLDTICALLVPRNGSREDIACFSLVSRRCSSAAARYRLERLQLELLGTQQLRQLVGELDHTFDRDGRVAYLRQMKLTGCISAVGEHEGHANTPRATSNDRCIRDREQNMHDNYYDMCTLPLSDGSALDQDSFGAVPTPEEKRLIDDAWDPLVRFICGLPGLTDLVYACTDQVPRCLLLALHTHHPKTRLHVHNFSLRSLYQQRAQRNTIDPDEYTLLTSPCLYTIVATWFEFDKHGRAGCNDAAIYRMIMGLAPALKQANVFHGFLDAPGQTNHGERPGLGEFFGCHGCHGSTTLSKGRLQALVTNTTSPDEIEDWVNCTDFSELRMLHLRSPIYSLGLQHIQRGPPLLRLRDLQLVYWRLAAMTTSRV